MVEPKSLRDVIAQEMRKNGINTTLSTKPYRENTRKLEAQRANDRQEGGVHYKKMGVEPWDVVDTWPIEQQIGYYRGGALKYIMRMGTKDEARQEIRKAEHYIQKLLEVLGESYGNDPGSKS